MSDPITKSSERQCPKCKEPLASDHRVCHNCLTLRPNKKQKRSRDMEPTAKKSQSRAENGCMIGCVVLMFVFLIPHLGNKIAVEMGWKKRSDRPAKVLTEEEMRKEKIKNGFNMWDGSHYELTKIIKRSMNDPKSYEHIETRYADHGNYLLVSTTFRGKNSFGGTVRNKAIAKVNLDGSVIDILYLGK